jgi:hypothetical protein
LLSCPSSSLSLADSFLCSYYWSGLELSTGGRIIQAVGSPFMGSSVAGSAADLGKVFGAGCGANFDLTRDGAALWMAGLNHTEAIGDVYYYSTQYETGHLINYCNMAINLLLNVCSLSVASL